MKQNTSECVKVVVRARPMNDDEKLKNSSVVVDFKRSFNQVILSKQNSKEQPKAFTYDGVYPSDSAQRLIYDETAFPIVESVMEGYNGTIFAYGQTGCGKTYTMVGIKDDPEKRGIIPNAFAHIFGFIDSNTQSTIKYLVRCSFMEIYLENIMDLLGKDEQNLEIKEDPQKGIFVKNITTVIVKCIKDIEKLMNEGNNNRHTAETKMNKESSRSHSIFTIYIECMEQKENDKARVIAGKLNLVDLAGSERQAKTQAVGDRLNEANKINLSLSALGNVISALVDGKSQHIPYRDSKLTRLLQDSLGGNTKTVMVAAISPANYNYDETLSTLRYASRAKNIKNRPIINEDPKDAMIKQYENEIKKLREMVENMGKNGNMQKIKDTENEIEKSFVDSNVLSMEQHTDKMKQLEKDKSELANLLFEREQVIVSEKEQKEKLQKMIQDMEEKVMVGGKKLEEREKVLSEHYKQMQGKLYKQMQKEKQLKQETQKKQEELQIIEQNYKDIKDELHDGRKLIIDLRNKYKSSQAEIKDIASEFQSQKEDLLDGIRNSNVELEFYKKSIQMLLPDAQVDLLKSKSKWDDENKVWNLPSFKVQDIQEYLPTLKQQSQVSEYIDNERNRREIVNTKGSSKDVSRGDEKEMQMTTLNKTGMPSVQLKKRKAEEIIGKYYNMDLHKLKAVVKNEDRVIKKIGQLESLPTSYVKNLPPLQTIGENTDAPKLALPHKVTKLSKIDDNLLSIAAKNLPLLAK